MHVHILGLQLLESMIFFFFFAVYPGLRTQDDSLWGATETY